MKKLIITLSLISSFSTNYAQTTDSVYLYLLQIGVQHAEIVTAQSIEETGHYKCTGCSLDKNNLFGFRWKKQYLNFETWQMSCDYYLRWQKRHYKGNDYYEFLDCIWRHKNGDCAKFATKEGYIDRVKAIKL